MDEYGRIEVRSCTPDVLARVAGKRIHAVDALWQDPPGMAVGWVSEIADARVGMANLGDELTIAPWPGEAWAAADVREADPPR